MADLKNVFFSYFKDKLQFFALWKENEWWPFFKGIAEHFDQLRKDTFWVRDQFFIDRCDDRFLKLYGDSRGIVQFPFESEEDWKYRVKNAYTYYKEVGKQSTLSEFLSKYMKIEGIPNARLLFKNDVDIVQYPYLEDMGWAEFYIQHDSKDYVLGSTYQTAHFIINEIKRASVKGLIGVGFHYHLPEVEAPTHTSTVVIGQEVKEVAEDTPVYPVLDDTVDYLGKTLCRTIDSGWSLDTPEQNTSIVRRSI